MNSSKVATVLGIGIIAAPAANAVLVYEPFSGYAPATLSTTEANNSTPNANTVGLDRNVPYDTSDSSGFEFVSNGLTFGSGGTTLVTSGGALRVGPFTSGPDGAGAVYDFGSTPSGTLYGSYLVNFATKADALGGPRFGVRTTDARTESTLSTARLGSYADSYDNGAPTKAGVAYDSGTATASASSTALTTGTTYIVLSRFTNINSALGAGGAAGVATQWVLTEAQFNNFRAGGLTDSELESASVGTSSTQVFSFATESLTSGTYAFADGNALNFHQNASSSSEIDVRVDEVRFGTSLNDVTPIPEPATAALLGLGSLVLAARRRRRA